MGKFVIKKTNTGIKFDLKAGNGEVIATSEVYTTEEACKNGIASVQKNAPAAAVENQTVEGYKEEKHPKFEVYKDKAGEFRFRLKQPTVRLLLPEKDTRHLQAALTELSQLRRMLLMQPLKNNNIARKIKWISKIR